MNSFEIVNQNIIICADFDKISENGRNIYDKSIITTINLKLISIELSQMTRAVSQFEDSEYLYAINAHNQHLLSKVTNKGYFKLLPLDLIDVRLGRSTVIHITSFPLYFA